MAVDPLLKAVTASDVAALAGVSRWTVNRAFKKDASISEKSRKKVLQIAKHLGYAPNLLAASLASNHSKLVSLLIDDFANPYKLVLMEQLTQVLREHGWDTLLVNTLNEDNAPLALLNASQRQVDAAVLIGSKFNEPVLLSALGARRVRKIIVFARYSTAPNTLSICCDDQLAMTEITDHVIQQGYQQPLFLAGPQIPTGHLLRKETFITKWYETKGFTPQVTAVKSYDSRIAYQHIANYFAHKKTHQPDIIVCENDVLAMGAMDALRHELGINVPKDIAITGFDDIPQAANPNYQLTTYRQPITTMAESLVKILKGDELIEHKQLNQFTGQLVIRNSA